MSEFLKVIEVADLLRVSKATVQRWCAEGRLPAFKIGQQWRIHGAALREMIEHATDASDALDNVANWGDSG